MRIAAVTALALAAGLSAAAVRAEPAFPTLRRGFFQDCGPVGAASVVCRERRDLTAEEAQRRLGAQPVALWVEGDVFTVVARSSSDSVQMAGALNAPLARLPGTDLWTISARAKDLDHGLLDAFFRTGSAAALPPISWRGPRAEPQPELAERLTGRQFLVDIDSPNLHETRKLSVYLPPGFDPQARYPVTYLADGQTAAGYARVVEPLILSGKIRPLVLVGLFSGDGQRRADDYLLEFPTPESHGFEAHERFFLEEVIPRAEREWGASSRREDRLLMGHSNGAAWAVDEALRRPEMFGSVYAVSVAGRDRPAYAPTRPIRFFLAAGQLEPFIRGTRQVADGAAKAGSPVTFETPVAGHTPMVVEAYFDDALIAAFGTSQAVMAR